jgi:hypothetical protein
MTDKTWKVLFFITLSLLILVGCYLGARAILRPPNIEKDYTFTINVTVAGDFVVTLTPAVLTLKKGETGTIQITNAVSGGFDTKIQYAVAGLPADAFSFSVNPVAPGEATTMTIDTAALVSNTTYVCVLTARDI